MPICQGKRVVCISPAEYQREIVLAGLAKPSDVPEIKERR